MSELVKIENKQLVEVENITTLEQADSILNNCNDLDSTILEVFVNNAITRGAVYHKLSEVGDGCLGLLNSEVADRYGVSRKYVDNYKSIFENNIIFSSDSVLGYESSLELKPTLTSMLEFIKRDPANIELRISNNIENRGIINGDIKETISRYMEEDANEDIRYLFSTKNRVSLGRLSTAIKEKDEDKIHRMITLGGYSENRGTGSKEQRKLIKELEEKVRHLEEKSTMLENRNKFLIKSLASNEVERLLRRISHRSHEMKKFKNDPQLLNAFDILGVGVEVTEDALKKSYREKVHEFHPDKGGNEDMFRLIVEANNKIKKFIKGL